jgi:gamma-glutamylaminecyclotransferase
MKTLAVYGTLKGGYGNHYLLQDSEFVGEGKTVEKYRMCISGVPFVIRGAHIDGNHIDVEVYNVADDDVLSVDMLEGHPTWYRRERIPIKLESGVVKMCWLYFADERYDDGIYYSNYGLKGR